MAFSFDFLSHQQQHQAKLAELQKQLDQLKKEKRRIRHDLASEKLEYLKAHASDPKTRTPTDMVERQRQLLRKIPVVAQTKRVQQVVATYRFTGISTFVFKNVYRAIRLDPFYNRRYYEPYYIMVEGTSILWTSLPSFITPLTDIQDHLGPDSLDTLVRALQEALLAYIARREQLEEFKVAVRNAGVVINTIGTTGSGLRITCPLVTGASYAIDLRYKDTGSMYPTQVKVKGQADQSVRERIEQQGGRFYWDPKESDRIINAFTTKTLLQAYRCIFPSPPSVYPP